MWQFISEYQREIIGAIIGLLLGWLVPIIFYLRIKFLDYLRYKKYNGSYKVYLKENPTEKAQYSITLKVKGNIFIIAGFSYKGNKENIRGKIEMDRNLKNFGRGYYTHELTIPGVRKFGFYEIQLDEDRILAHQIIKGINDNGIGEDKSAGYIWFKEWKHDKSDL